VRYLVFAAALLFVFGLGLLTVLYIQSSGVTVVGVVGVIVFVICAVGVVGSLLNLPRR
jgi:hypothetical protein